MKMLARVGYGLGLVSILGLTGYHFFLPHHAQWGQLMASMPAALGWALELLNFAWSLAIMSFAATMLVFLWRPDQGQQVKQIASLGFMVYWVGHTGFLILNPMPLPVNLGWIQMVMVGFAGVTTALMALGPVVFHTPKSRT